MRPPEGAGRPVRAYAWAGWLAVAAVITAVAPQLGPAGQEFAYALVGLASVACVIVGVQLNRPARPYAWLLLAAGLTCGALANACWGVQFLRQSAEPRFSVVDVVYFAMYPLLAAGLAVLPERPAGGSRGAGLPEAGIVACTGATHPTIQLYDPYVVDLGREPANTATNAYP
jgi:hypothetical protein